MVLAAAQLKVESFTIHSKSASAGLECAGAQCRSNFFLARKDSDVVGDDLAASSESEGSLGDVAGGSSALPVGCHPANVWQEIQDPAAAR